MTSFDDVMTPERLFLIKVFIILPKRSFCKICWSACSLSHQKRSFLRDMLVGRCVCLSVCLSVCLCVIISQKHFSHSLGYIAARNLSCGWASMTHHDSNHFWRSIMVKVKGQGHFRSILGSQRNAYFLSSFDPTNFKFGGNVAYVQALSWLVFGVERPWPWEVRWRVKKLTPRSNFHIAAAISCSTSN